MPMPRAASRPSRPFRPAPGKPQLRLRPADDRRHVLLHGDGAGRRLGGKHARPPPDPDPLRRALDLRARARGLTAEHHVCGRRGVVAVVGIFRTSSTASGLLALLTGVLTITIVLVLAFSIIDQGEINPQSITGAICIYILLGMIFLFSTAPRPRSGMGRSSRRGRTGRAPCGSTSATSRWRLSATATTRRRATSAMRWRSSRRCWPALPRHGGRGAVSRMRPGVRSTSSRR